ncbi:MAG: hypothetical protein Fur002_09820 [Anaerolineales bacterium]
MNRFLRASMFVHLAAALFFAAALAYLGWFARPLGDDYCETVQVRASSPLGAVLQRYEEGKWRAANRYSNLFFVGVLNFFGEANFRIAPAVMLILWGAGLVWLLWQIRSSAALNLNPSVMILLAAWLTFFALQTAPNRFQILYWRSSMATHFAPLVFLNFMLAGFLKLSQRAKSLPVGSEAAFFLFSFVIAGFSEPPNTVMITAFLLALAYTFFFIKDETRAAKLRLLSSMLAGAAFSLAVMAASPAAQKVSADAPSLPTWMYRFTEYTYLFTLDAFRAFPLPFAVSALSAALLFFCVYLQREDLNTRAALRLAGAAPLMFLLLVAAGFSTSAYGQSYPVGRARFFAHVLLAALTLLEGALAGAWLARFGKKFSWAQVAAALALLILAAYPLRAGWQLLRVELPKYQTRAVDWDKRDALIRSMAAEGQTDLTVYQMDGFYSTKELDTYATHWVNQCAADYYGVKTIRAISR